MKSITDKYALYNGDCVEITAQLPDNSVHFEIFSPPFANLYIYSDDLRDMGNCKNEAEFFRSMDYLTPNLYRVLLPGRLCAVHCKQLARYKGRDGAAGWYDFRGDIIRHFERHGYQYHSEVVIWTDPVLEMQKTKTQRLLYCNLQRDASVTGIGMPEYLVLFRKSPKDGDETLQIKHYKTAEDTEKHGGDISQVIDLPMWQRYASPVWFDIRRTDVLNARAARNEKDEKHICPLQLEVIRRATLIWSNPGEVVFSPFGGIGSEPYIALEQKRKAIATELKPEYFAQMVENCERISGNDDQISFEEAL
jgi:DNA modification methylase